MDDKVFDSARPMSSRLPSPEGLKVVKYRFPTDQECCDRMRAQRTIIRGLGRGKSQTEVAGAEEVDLALFRKLKVEGPELDAAEASMVLGAALRVRAEPIEYAGKGYRIKLKVPGAVVEHELRMPSVKELEDYREASISDTQGRHNVTEVRAFLEPSGELYDRLMIASTGYASPVPIVHKAAVVAEIRADIDALNEEQDPEA